MMVPGVGRTSRKHGPWEVLEAGLEKGVTPCLKDRLSVTGSAAQ